MFRRLLLPLLTAAFLCLPANATWSILVVNTRTGEVAIASATCLAFTNLLATTPVVVPGKGVGVIQAAGNTGLLPVIGQGLRDGLTAAEIFEAVRNADNSINQRQIGIVVLDGGQLTFTGSGAGPWRGGVAGEFGDYAYAIQGNVLSGPGVVAEAEAALINTPGDMSQKIMASMVAARVVGGDGRCSCDLALPESCGDPVVDFEKSAHCGFVVVARMGDGQAPCVMGQDCASADYYLKQNIRGPNAGHNAPDPVDQLVDRYDTWRTNRSGRPDAILSVVNQVDPLPADGVSLRIVTVQLVDIEGVPLMSGGADVQVAPLEGTTPITSVGAVTDNGDGTYSFPVTAGTEVGTDTFVITAADDLVTARLFPYLEIESVQAGPLAIGATELSAAAGGTVDFSLDVPDREFGLYWILASLSGTDPGVDLGPFLHIPLNPDRATIRTLVLAGRPDILPGTFGILDDQGHADAAFIARPGMMLDFVGQRLDWAALVLRFGQPPVASNAVGFDIVP